MDESMFNKNQDTNNSGTPEQSINSKESNESFKLHKEVLDITKNRVQTAEVTARKEIITEDRTITVPVTREEIVIEKKVLDPNSPNNSRKSIEVARIPISEEKIDITKHPVTLEEVNIYNNTFEQIAHIDAKLKEEKLHIETTGNAKITVRDNP